MDNPSNMQEYKELSLTAVMVAVCIGSNYVLTEVAKTLYDDMLKAWWDVDAESHGAMALYVKVIKGEEETRYWIWWS